MTLEKPVLPNKPPSEPREFGFFVDGQSMDIGDREVFERRSPAHDVPVTRTPRCTISDLEHAVSVARRTFNDRVWSDISSADRATILLRAATIVRARVDEIATIETLENGKPISQSQAEVEGAAGLFEYAAGAARALHGDSFNNLGEKMFGLVTREPVGVVGVITPWNFPFYILCERIPFILAAGCTVVAKPSEATAASTLILAEVLTEAGLPNGVFNVITGSGSKIGQAIAEHPGIDMVSFTGSTEVGRHLVRAASEDFKRLGLELGGKNPHIVFADADLDDAADGVAFALSFNTGQCCVSGSRLIIEQSVAKEFESLLKKKLSKIVVGDPLDPATQVGAITTQSQNQAILRYIETGVSEGATLAFGGKALNVGAGHYISPTLFTNVTSGMTIAREEIFGPVLSMMTFQSREEALHLANDTPYGLAASIWTKDVDKALECVRGIRAGRVWVNTTITGGPEMPIGGFKQSGWGRETGIYGVEEYTQIKSTHIELGKRTHWVAP